MPRPPQLGRPRPGFGRPRPGSGRAASGPGHVRARAALGPPAAPRPAACAIRSAAEPAVPSWPPATPSRAASCGHRPRPRSPVAQPEATGVVAVSVFELKQRGRRTVEASRKKEKKEKKKRGKRKRKRKKRKKGKISGAHRIRVRDANITARVIVSLRGWWCSELQLRLLFSSTEVSHLCF